MHSKTIHRIMLPAACKMPEVHFKPTAPQAGCPRYRRTNSPPSRTSRDWSAQPRPLPQTSRLMCHGVWAIAFVQNTVSFLTRLRNGVSLAYELCLINT